MSATHDERRHTLAARDDIQTVADALGHTLQWRLGPDATRKGHPYYFTGACVTCGANVDVGPDWTRSSWPDGDPRTETCEHVQARADGAWDEAYPGGVYPMGDAYEEVGPEADLFDDIDIDDAAEYVFAAHPDLVALDDTLNNIFPGMFD